MTEYHLRLHDVFGPKYNLCVHDIFVTEYQSSLTAYIFVTKYHLMGPISAFSLYTAHQQETTVRGGLGAVGPRMLVGPRGPTG